jgi:hypothetical protein
MVETGHSRLAKRFSRPALAFKRMYLELAADISVASVADYM